MDTARKWACVTHMSSVPAKLSTPQVIAYGSVGIPFGAVGLPMATLAQSGMRAPDAPRSAPATAAKIHLAAQP